MKFDVKQNVKENSYQIRDSKVTTSESILKKKKKQASSESILPKKTSVKMKLELNFVIEKLEFSNI